MRRDVRRGESGIAICVHPPERRRRPANVAACGCCCCCCCLHTLGGLIGSAGAGKSRTQEEQQTTITYWLCLLGALLVTWTWSSLQGGDLTETLLIVALLLPGYQLATSVIAAIIARVMAGPAALPRIWAITWRGFLGALIGFGIMLAHVFAISERWGGMILVILGLLVVFSLMYSLRRVSQRVPT